jgi:RNA polymerase sigma factor (sigma-70 family)
MSMSSISTCPGIPDLAENCGNAPAVDTVQVEQLYSAYSHELKAFLQANTRSDELVEVMMQDIYLKLIGIPDLSVIQNPSAYLNRLANNLLIDHCRQQQRHRQRIIEQAADDIDYADLSPSPIEQIHYHQLLHAYQLALLELPAPVQQVVRLFHIDGLSQRDIARKLGKSVSWVEKSITKALVHCRPRLDDFDY